MGEQLHTRQFQRILLVKPSSLGDIVHALPVLHGLRTRFPKAHISWLVFDRFAPLIEAHPELDELIRLGRASPAARRGGDDGASGWSALRRLVRGLRRRQFDLVIDLQGLFRSGFLSLATGCAVRIGFARARELAWMFYTHPILTDHPDAHAADRNYRVAHMLGFADVPMKFDLAVTDAERQRASALLENVGIGPNEPFQAALPGARWETKRWSPQNFAIVLDRVRAAHGLAGVLLGAPDERETCDAAAQLAKSRPANLAGQTGIRELVALIERAAVVLAHDSAPMHLAAALRRPLVAILGPTNADRTGPYAMPAAVVQANLNCVPCYLKRLRQCPYDHACMRWVAPEAIAERIITIGSQLRGPPPPATVPAESGFPPNRGVDWNESADAGRIRR